MEEKVLFIKNCWYVAAQDAEVTADAIISRVVIDEPLALYRAGGKVVVLEDRCCHRWAPLSLGRIEDGNLRCMYHGFKFDRAGNCIDIPGETRIPAGAGVRHYPSVLSYGWVWVWMGDPAKADEKLLPATPYADGYGSVFEGFSGKLDYKANYELINDNLTDFSHLSYVHASSFGAGAEFSDIRPKVQVLPRGVRVDRWLLDDTVTPRYIPNLEGNNYKTWITYDYLAPGVLMLDIEVHTAASYKASAGTKPQGEPIHQEFSWQAVTPVNANTTRYYFSWGLRKSENLPHVPAIMQQITGSAFDEDRQMIEAQQRSWETGKKGRMYGSSADLGMARMREVISKLLREEQDEMV